MHFGNSGVDYHNPQHIEQLRRVFRAANGYRMPIVVHIRASFSLEAAYGRDEARVFLSELVPAAPDVVIQIAHMAGGGAPGDQLAQQASKCLRRRSRRPSLVPSSCISMPAE